ncbi:MAG: DUF4160 domain-containing protein [Clostridia bacterium]|nr:DUF4160 domain-containing protein [Deltaproteobacteria bacterium]
MGTPRTGQLRRLEFIACPIHTSPAPVDDALVAIQEGTVLSGYLPGRQLKLVLAWAELHTDELMQNWELARANEPLCSIEGLR